MDMFRPRSVGAQLGFLGGAPAPSGHERVGRPLFVRVSFEGGSRLGPTPSPERSALSPPATVISLLDPCIGRTRPPPSRSTHPLHPPSPPLTPTPRSVQVRRCLQVLCRRRKNNPVLQGDPGVGKVLIGLGLG